MMEVNAFWFGFLIGVIAVFVLIMAISLFGNRSVEETEEVEISPEELKEFLEKATGRQMRVLRDEDSDDDD